MSPQLFEDRATIEQVAVCYRSLILWYATYVVAFFCLLACVLGFPVLAGSETNGSLHIAPPVLVIGLWVTILGAEGVAVYHMYRTMKLVKAGPAWLWSLGVLAPCFLGVAVIVFAGGETNKWLRARGAAFAGLWPAPEDIANLRRDGVVSAEDFVRRARAAGEIDDQIMETLVRSGWSLTDAQRVVSGIEE